jgi:hypothetical protein
MVANDEEINFYLILKEQKKKLFVFKFPLFFLSSCCSFACIQNSLFIHTHTHTLRKRHTKLYKHVSERKREKKKKKKKKRKKKK